MALMIANVLVWMLVAYASIGMVVGVWFVSLGVVKVDPAALNAPWLFRLVILPGAAALWPWVLAKLVRRVGRERP